MNAKTRNRTRTIAKWAAAPLGIAVSGVLVLGFSNAAYTAQTSNTGNSWSTGSVALNNNLTKPMFDFTNPAAGKAQKDNMLVPGTSTQLTNSITVNYTGNTPVAIKLYSALGSDAGAIAPYVDVKINDGSTDIFNGTLSQLAAKNNYATGIGGWSPTTSASKTYTFTVWLDAAAPNTTQGQSITGTNFTWEAQTP